MRWDGDRPAATAVCARPSAVPGGLSIFDGASISGIAGQSSQLSDEQRQLVLKQEELGLAQTAVAAGLSPSHRIWELARGRGFDSWLAQQQANGNGAAYAPSPAPTYAPPVSNGYAPPVPNGGPSAVQQIEAINRGQQAARSLSNAGGASINAFSARDLATMTDDEFAAVFNRLQASGNKAKLRELMGT